MNRVMQSAASALALAAAVGFVPFPANAQQQQPTETEAEQAVEEAAQETGEALNAVEGAVEDAGQAVEESVGEPVEQAGEAAGQAVEDAAGEVGEAVEQTTQTIEAEVIEQEPETEAPEAEAEVIVREPEAEPEVIVREPDTEAEPEAEPVENAELPADTAAMPPEEVAGTIVMQDENSFLTSDLMNAALYSPAGDKVGDIQDVILSLDGTVEGVVIGVGGFLGIGEKHVAVEMQQISLQTDEDGEPQLTMDTTREAMEAAPEFVSVEDQKDAAVVEPTGAMTADPAAGAVPAGTPPAGEAQPVVTTD